MVEDGVVERLPVQKVPHRERARLADLLQRVLGVLSATDDPADRAIRRDVQQLAEQLRGLSEDPS
jgi:type VI protein secretion system component VasF